MRPMLVLGLGLLVNLLIAGCPQDMADNIYSLGPAGPGATSADTTGTATAADAAASDRNLAGITAGGVTTTDSGCANPAQADAWKDEVLQLVNLERSRVGLGALSYNAGLEAQADAYACELITYDYFDHVNPDTGSTLADRSTDYGYDYWIVGENLAAGQRTPIEVVQAWMDSPGHRENILNASFTELGIGIKVGGKYGTYWVQEFGRPRDAGRPAPQVAPS